MGKSTSGHRGRVFFLLWVFGGFLDVDFATQGAIEIAKGLTVLFVGFLGVFAFAELGSILKQGDGTFSLWVGDCFL